MRWIIIVVAFIAFPSLALAQTASPPAASDINTERCQVANPTTASAYGVVTTFTGCTQGQGQTPNDYGRVHIQWVPPQGTNPADLRLTGNRRTRFLNGLRRFVGIQNNQSGAIILEVYNREGAQIVPGTAGSASSQSLGTLIYTRALAAFEINETNGLQVTSLTGDTEGPIGPYIIDAPGSDGIEWRVTVRTSQEPLDDLLKKLETVNAAVGTVSGSPLVVLGEAGINLASMAQTQITQLFTRTAEYTRPGSLSFSGGTQVATARIALSPVDATASSRNTVFDLQRSGFLRLKVVRKASLFQGAHEFDSTGVLYRWGIGGGQSAILNESFNNRLLSEIVSEGMGGGTTYQALQSEDAGAFQVSCQALSNFLTSNRAPRFNQDDLAAVRWAFAFSGANIANPVVRRTPCAQDFLRSESNAIALTARGLTIRPATPPPPPARFQLVLAQGQQTAGVGATDARKGEDAYAVSLDQDTLNLETESQTFVGVATNEPPSVVGRVQWRGSVRTGDHFIGYAIRPDQQSAAITVTGYGRLEFADNPESRALADLAGTRPLSFNGYVRNGLPSNGRLLFADNSYFEGRLIDGQPFEGVFVRASGAAQYGRFARFKLNGEGLENTDGALRWGIWVNGNLPIVNPSS